jgi:RNA 2',3'-cyclic 3'-phosphodiesterase
MRAFVAVDVSSDALVKLQNEIITSASGWTPKDVKQVEPHNFHFTLIFLGEISDNDTDKIKEKLVGFSFEPFSISYTGIGGFPTTAHARAVWVGVDSLGAQKLTALANGVIANLSELGFKADKPFSAHMTIIRSKSRPVNASSISSKYQGRAFGSDLIEKVHLKKSELRTSGPIYSNVYTLEAKK